MPKSVKQQQAAVVRWMESQLDRLGWSAEQWARAAGLSPTTVTRALTPAPKSVSSVPTLHALARAARVPSVIDFLEGDAMLNLSPDAMTVLIEELFPIAGIKTTAQQRADLAILSAEVRRGLGEQETHLMGDRATVRVLAKAARAHLREHKD